MAKKSMILKQQREPKFSSRRYKPLQDLRPSHAYLRDYGICRILLPELPIRDRSPALRKQSW